MKVHQIILGFALCVFVSGCSKWLDVKPSDRVTEENTFSTAQSFRQALNGIYIELNNETLYGKTLTSEFVDILAQYYAIHPESVNNYELLQYDYTSAANRSKIESIWASAYNLIANTNKIIENAELNNSVLPTDEHDLIYGEALALRAMLHFDLFRLFGPVYTKGSNTSSIPYYTEFSLDVKEQLPADEYIAQVIEDLTIAMDLLKNDPVVSQGAWHEQSSKFHSLRVFRLNYYAVKALLARVYLYAEEDEKAFQMANEVIEIQEQWFPWTDPTAVGSDKVFSTEVLFGLQNIRRRDVFTSLFDARSLNEVNALSPLEDIVNYVYFYNERHDYRYIANLQSTVLQGNTSYKLFEKYGDNTDSLKNQIIPMIRMSEVYYIAAECDPDKTAGLARFHTVRANRGIAPGQWDSYDFPDPLLKTEYIREFWGEGQLFFFYKRKKMESIQSATHEFENITMSMSNYVLPIPDGETKYN